MSDTMAWVFAIGLLVGAHLWMNIAYATMYRRLKLRYVWAAHGLLLFGKRARDWEVGS